jgi:CarD family transcriptional regulator
VSLEGLGLERRAIFRNILKPFKIRRLGSVPKVDTISSERPRRQSISDERSESRPGAYSESEAKHDFAVGEKVVSPRHGVGVVVDRSARPLNGVELEYLTISVERRGLRLLVPVDGAPPARLRAVSSRSEMTAALTALGADPELLPENWRTRQREAVQRLSVGSSLATAELIRDIAYCGRDRRLAATDRELYESAREVFEEELQATLEIGPRQAMKQVRECLRRPSTTAGPN